MTYFKLHILMVTAACYLWSVPANADELDQLRTSARTLFGTITAVTQAEIDDPRVRLGQALFWDMRLSFDGRTACASCHFRDSWGADSRQFSVNARGALTSRHAQTVFNSQDAGAGLRWVGDRPSGADQAIGSITGSMGFTGRDDIVPSLQQYGYADRFAAAFPDEPDPVSAANYGLALQLYQKTLRNPAAFDQWLAGDNTAMNELQARGLQRFISTGCSGCHSGPLLGGEALQRFGIMEDYQPYTKSQKVDTGLMSVTKNENDRNIFRVQPLRNVANTAPYFHDGSVPDLASAVDIMAKVQLGQTLDKQALGEIVAFLQALTGAVPANYLAPEGIPFELPADIKAAGKAAVPAVPTE